MSSDETTMSSSPSGSNDPSSADGTTSAAAEAPVRRTRRRAATRPAGPPEPLTTPPTQPGASQAGSGQSGSGQPGSDPSSTGGQGAVDDAPTTDSGAAVAAPAAKRAGRRTSKKAVAAATTVDDSAGSPSVDRDGSAGEQQTVVDDQPSATTDQPAVLSDAVEATVKRSSSRRRTAKAAAADPFSASSPSPSPSPSTLTSAQAGAGQEAGTSQTSADSSAAGLSSLDGTADSDIDGAPITGSATQTSRPAPAFSPVFQAPDPLAAVGRRSSSALQLDAVDGDEDEELTEASSADELATGDGPADDVTAGSADEQATGTPRRRRSRGGRNRRKPSDGSGSDSAGDASSRADASSTTSHDSRATDPGDSPDAIDHAEAAESGSASKPAKKSSGRKSSGKKGAKETVDDTDASADQQASDSGGEPSDTEEGAGTSSSSRRRRRRRRSGDGPGEGGGDAPETVVKVREPRAPSDKITSVEGSTRIEAKKQRRREGREAGRRRAPILSESEFLARRESVDRVMVIRQREDVTQIAVLEDSVLVEHYVALDQQSSLIGNVYLGRVQNVLPSMEAAFIDIGKGRNAVLYAGEVNWDLVSGHQPRRIENALKSGQQILVQVSKDPVGHKGARLTSQISLPGRYLVYVPGGGSSGISRKLPDTERSRLKNLLKGILPDESGVIIRTAAEGASEEELTRDVRRLTERWAEIEKLVKTGKGPALLYAEPDVTLRVVRDLFTEDFGKLVVSGDDAWETVTDYVSYVAPDLTERLERYDGAGDVFANYRVDEQIAKALERKVWLPSGGSLVIDRTEAMTVVDVNTGKFTGSGGNLEQTVTKNNLEAAEEIVRQLRLRDIGGIIVIDFIDMVLENNRDLVLRRLVECLGRDRTRHQVAEVTSLGLVQMTRKRIGTGLVEAFSVPCEQCNGRGVVIESEPVKGQSDEAASSGGRSSAKRPARQRSSSKAEPEEQVSPLVAERHSAAAAATAAIAAALHPEHRSAANDASTGPTADAEALATVPASRSGAIDETAIRQSVDEELVEGEVDDAGYGDLAQEPSTLADSADADLVDIGDDDDDTYGFEPIDMDPRVGEPDGRDPSAGLTDAGVAVDDSEAAVSGVAAPAKKSAPRKAAAKKATAKKATTKKAAAKKTTAKTAGRKATSAKKTSAPADATGDTASAPAGVS